MVDANTRVRLPDGTAQDGHGGAGRDHVVNQRHMLVGKGGRAKALTQVAASFAPRKPRLRRPVAHAPATVHIHVKVYSPADVCRQQRALVVMASEQPPGMQRHGNNGIGSHQYTLSALDE